MATYCPAVSLQVATITVDTAARSFEGWTELKAAIPVGQTVVGIHAWSLSIQGVQVNGCEAGFSVTELESEPLPKDLKSGEVKGMVPRIAHLASEQYSRFLAHVANPQLRVSLPKDWVQQAGGCPGPSDTHGDGTVTNGYCSKEQVLEVTIRIQYSSMPHSGIRFCDGYAYTDSSLHRTSAWLPCADFPDKLSVFEMDVRVRSNEMAICSGQLVSWRQDSDENWKWYKYKVCPHVSPSLLSIAVGPFCDPLPCTLKPAPKSPRFSTRNDRGLPIVTQFAPEGSREALEVTMSSFPLTFRLVEELLGAPYPLPFLQVVFLPDLSANSRVAHSCCCLEECLLIPSKRVIDQVVETQLEMVRCLARQWFGVVLMPKSPADTWILEGLAGWLVGRFMGRVLGKNELAYRTAKQRRAVCMADDGSCAPLCPRGAAAELAGTEWLERPQLLVQKATVVMAMIEKKVDRIGPEAFRRAIQRLVVGAVESIRTGHGHSARFISTHSFMKEMGQAGGIRNEIQAFAERWIYGQGCPSLDVSIGFDPKTSALEVDIWQAGPEAVKEAAERALAMSRDGAVGEVKVAVTESVGTSEHSVRLGLEPHREERIKVQGRQKRRRRADVEDLEDDFLGPVKYMRVDPGGEWLANVRVSQPGSNWIAPMWANMLEDAKDVVAEMEAIEGLVAAQPHGTFVINCLMKYLKSNGFCRNRADAAMAIGMASCKDNEFSGASSLCAFYRDRWYDRRSRLPARNSFHSLDDYIVGQAMPFSLAAARDSNANTPAPALHLLMEVLDHNDNEGNEFDDADWLTAWLCAIGEARVGGDNLGEVVQRLQRYLTRDEMFPSHHHVITCGCLRSLAQLSLQHPPQPRKQLLKLLRRYCEPSRRTCVRRAAWKGALHVSASLGGPDGCLACLLECLSNEGSCPAVRLAVLEEALIVLMRFGSKVRGKKGVSFQSLEALYATMTSCSDAQSWHFVFLVFMALADEPLTTHRRHEEAVPPSIVSKPSKAAHSSRSEQHKEANGIPPNGSQADPGPSSQRAPEKFIVKFKLGSTNSKS
eukprot:evm.model.scf_162EXC.1 EVM.evm.TU.scf_162EXC.1   scf_162EXC:10587-25319(-)